MPCQHLNHIFSTLNNLFKIEMQIERVVFIFVSSLPVLSWVVDYSFLRNFNYNFVSNVEGVCFCVFFYDFHDVLVIVVIHVFSAIKFMIIICFMLLASHHNCKYSFYASKSNVNILLTLTMRANTDMGGRGKPGTEEVGN